MLPSNVMSFMKKVSDKNYSLCKSMQINVVELLQMVEQPQPQQSTNENAGTTFGKLKQTLSSSLLTGRVEPWHIFWIITVRILRNAWERASLISRALLRNLWKWKLNNFSPPRSEQKCNVASSIAGSGQHRHTTTLSGSARARRERSRIVAESESREKRA